ncbi:hypothetical protein H4Q26_002585 [Puccinia striiformis f. sp. tritici PST-130]|nr:hypothetical protein H4Q26_002585 [Puccinia striiformis f. sp. tritici PST-130]
MDISSTLHSEHSHQADPVIEAFANLLDKCKSIGHSTFQRSRKIPNQPGIKKRQRSSSTRLSYPDYEAR